MARIDPGIEIEAAQEDLPALKAGRRTKLSGRHVVVGEIRYEAEQAGKLVYIKAAFSDFLLRYEVRAASESSTAVPPTTQQ